MSRYDAAVIGTGPAGLEAAINLKIRNKRFLLFGSQNLSRKLEAAPRIDNYLGSPGVSGKELQQRFNDHLAQMEIPILDEQVQVIYPMGDFFALASGDQTYEASAVILATGAFTAKPLPGEEEFLGRGVGHCATCDAPLYRGKTVAVLGYTDEAVRETNFIAEIVGKTYYVPMKKTSRMPGEGVEVQTGKVEAIDGDTVVRSLRLGGRDLPVDAVFVLREAVAPASLLPGIDMQDGFIHVDAQMQTNIPGCFAAGDCTGKPHQYMRAAGQGQTAALNAVSYLDNLK